MLSGIWSNFCNNSNHHCIAVTIDYELILETFQTTSEQTMQIFSILILETFIQTVHNYAIRIYSILENVSNDQWVSHSFILYSNYRKKTMSNNM